MHLNFLHKFKEYSFWMSYSQAWATFLHSIPRGKIKERNSQNELSFLSWRIVMILLHPDAYDWLNMKIEK